MINAIAQLATVNARIGRIFNQSETENVVNKTNMHDTRTLIDTRRCRANNSHIDSHYHSLQPLENESDFNCHTQPPICKITANHPKMNNNNDENQNARQFRNDRQIRYHWGADDEIMGIINNREKSPETTELVRRRTELARPRAMRSQGNKGLGREIYVPRRPEEDERREVKRIDIRLKRKQEQSRIGGGYIRNFGDEIPRRSENTEQGNNNNENRDTESTISSNTEEAVTKHEPGSYPAQPFQECRDGPIEDIAFHYVRINRVVEQKAARNKQEEDNIRAAELDFMLDLETAAGPDLIDMNCCLEENTSQ